MNDISNFKKLAQRIFCACFIVLISLVTIHPVIAETELDAAQYEVEQTAQAYNEAQAAYDEIQAEIQTNEKRLEELQIRLPQLQEDAGKVIHSAYKMTRETPNLISIILASDSLSDFLQTMHQMEVLQGKYMKSITELNAAQDELKEKSETLEKQKAQAETTLSEAQTALNAATAARVAAQERILKQQEKEKAEAEAAIREAASSKQKTYTPKNTENKAPVEVPKNPSTGPVDWTVGRDAFVSTWTKRIDNYLAGSPMAGTGRAFAEAAWDSGVDPRWSPAIAHAESTKGRYVPYGNSNNAWGWTAVGGGFRRFDSFEEGARAHVSYLGRVYGPSITPSAAKKYVGTSHWNYWYSSVLAQMEQI